MCYHTEFRRSTHLDIHISENRMLHVRWHPQLLSEFNSEQIMKIGPIVTTFCHLALGVQ